MPATNYFGNFSLSLQASDGTVWSLMNSMTITVSAVNDIPTISDVNVSTDEDVTYTFARSNLTGNYTDIENSALSSLKIMSLPSGTHGVLKYNNVNVTVNQEIAIANTNLLTFVPTLDYNGNAVF